MLSFALYLIGSIVCIAGLAWLATLLGASQMYVTAAAALLLAIAIFAAASHRRALEPPAS
jgi:positive regulator of sigma E activity